MRVDRVRAPAYRPYAMGIAERWRGYGRLPHDVRERVGRLPELFKAKPVRLAYVFGSAAAEGASDDVDVAILMREGSPLELWDDLVRVLGTDRVDLVDLAQAPPLLRFHVVRAGTLLFSESGASENEFELAAIREYRDTRHLRNIQDAYLQERARP